MFENIHDTEKDNLKNSTVRFHSPPASSPVGEWQILKAAP
jgi:hypothetical protein